MFRNPYKGIIHATRSLSYSIGIIFTIAQKKKNGKKENAEMEWAPNRMIFLLYFTVSSVHKSSYIDADTHVHDDITVMR